MAEVTERKRKNPYPFLTEVTFSLLDIGSLHLFVIDVLKLLLRKIVASLTFWSAKTDFKYT